MKSFTQIASGVLSLSEDESVLNQYIEENSDEIAGVISDICGDIHMSPDSLTESEFDDVFDLAVEMSLNVLSENLGDVRDDLVFGKLSQLGFRKNPKRVLAQKKQDLSQNPDVNSYFRKNPARKPSQITSPATKNSIRRNSSRGWAARSHTLNKLESSGVDLSKIKQSHTLHFRKKKLEDGSHIVEILAHPKSAGKFSRKNAVSFGHVQIHTDESGSHSVKGDPSIYRDEQFAKDHGL